MMRKKRQKMWPAHKPASGTAATKVQAEGVSGDEGGEVGIVRTQFFRFGSPSDPFILDCGLEFGPIEVAYETYGELNAERSNAILILHALSGDAHAAGWHEGSRSPGWWDIMIGPGKPFDTNRYFVICSNVLGGCQGTTGPKSIDPTTGSPYGLDFPLITIGDMVRVQWRLVEHLGIQRLLAVAGGSMGGMQGLEWLRSFPDKLCGAIVIATCARHSPQQIAFNEVGRQAIISDPSWNEGRYLDDAPAKGLALARMIGHITYMSEASMSAKFGRRFNNENRPHRFSGGFEVEGYLHYKGNGFVRRFDANSYLYITRAMDSYDLSGGRDLHLAFQGMQGKIMLIAFKSDWLYPPAQSREIARACQRAGVETTYCEIDSDYGHDAFLLEYEEEGHLIRHFLNRITRDTPLSIRGASGD